MLPSTVTGLRLQSGLGRPGGQILIGVRPWSGIRHTNALQWAILADELQCRVDSRP